MVSRAIARTWVTLFLAHDMCDLGPIVRITPDEIHINDAEWNDALYAKSPKQNKYEWMAGRFGNNSSVFTTAEASLHRVRRAPLNPM